MKKLFFLLFCALIIYSCTQNKDVQKPIESSKPISTNVSQDAIKETAAAKKDTVTTIFLKKKRAPVKYPPKPKKVVQKNQ